MISHPPLRRRKALIDLLTTVTNVIGTKERERLSGCSVAASATDLLVVRLNRFRQVCMGNPTDVWLVDPHAKGDGRNHDQPVLLLKTPLNNTTVLRLHPAVVMTGGMPRFSQRLRDGFCFGPRAAIDNSRLPFSRSCE